MLSGIDVGRKRSRWCAPCFSPRRMLNVWSPLEGRERVGRGLTPAAQAKVGSWPPLFVAPRAEPDSSLQEAIDKPALHNRGLPIGLILSIIAEHVRQHLG